ncbi:MAG: phosphate signaling complex protein PhoU [Euryarchaeota archaeon]|nr:phosphate signaling complex protein PhoU [Euryarchaeota archaeon]
MTRDQFQDQISDLSERVTDMWGHAKGMLEDGVRAFETLDLGLAEEVDERKERLADLDEEIEMQALRLLALQQPIAGDLRRIGATLKLITYINRIGRYGRDIGNVVKAWPEGQPHVMDLVDLPVMAEVVDRMVAIVLDAFRAEKAPDLEELTRLEDRCDAMRRQVWRVCLSYMAQDPRNIEACAHYMMVARYLERCGDNVCKMAEKTVYAFAGKRVIVK